MIPTFADNMFIIMLHLTSPDMESCTESANINKHRLSADAIWEATSLCHDNAAFEQHGNHQTFNNIQI